jgi:hypothetical protein
MNLKIKILFVSIGFLTTCPLFCQTTTDQNGLKTTVLAALYANTTQARRYEIASVAYNSYHWQTGGLIIIELFEEYFGTGYEKYVVENGFGQGANSGSPILKLIESNGINHSAKIVLGNPIDLTTSYGGYVNMQLPILLDIRYYAGYKVKIAYIQQKVDVLVSPNQIKINDAPTGIDIPDFSVSTELAFNLATSGNLNVTGGGNHFIKNGNVGIGTVSPGHKLDVIGTIKAREIKVDLTGADFVFENEYKLMPLNELEKFIKINKHLPEIAAAKDMQENGANLGELNTKLLQKIEELTLYTIEQNKKIITLEKKMEKMESALK